MVKFTLKTVILLVLYLHSSFLTAQELITMGGNSMSKTGSLNIKLGNEVVIAKDDLTTAAPLYQNANTKLQVNSNEKQTVLNIINTASEKIKFRKEVALHKNGQIEITSRFKVAPFQANHTVCHMVYIPTNLIMGAKFKALTGHKRTRVVTGKVGDRGWSKKLNQCHYVAFSGGKKDFAIDFNPYGVTDWMSYNKWGCPVGNWKCAAGGGFLKCWYGVRGTFYGGTFAGKIIIYEGEWDFEKRHPYKNSSYYGVKKPLKRFAFGSLQEGFVSADDQKYSSGKKWGWKNPQGLKVNSGDKKGILNNWVSCPEGTANTFLVDLVPGYYFFTLRFADRQNQAGPFKVSLNDIDQQEIKLPKGKSKTVLLKGFLKDGKAKISFSGKNWCINSIAVQAVIYEAEDFFINRKIWNTPGLPDFD